MLSKRKLNNLAIKLATMDPDHIQDEQLRDLSKIWKVPVQDLSLAVNIAIQKRELLEVEKLDGGSGNEAKKTTIASILEIFMGDRRI